MYITLNSDDNTIQLSKRLRKKMKLQENDFFWMFKADVRFAMAKSSLQVSLNTSVSQFDRTKFIAVCPTVALIDYELNLEPGINVIKIEEKTINNDRFYAFKPKE